jgi:tetratricopeptide (TPR) repeat protein
MSDVYLQVTAVRPDQRAALLENYKRYELQSQIVGYRKSLEVHLDDPWSQEGLAACYVGQGKLREAIAILEQRLTIGPRAAYPMVSLGMVCLASGEVSRAESLHREAISIDREYPLAWLGLGKALVAQKEHDAAEKSYRRALELAPGLLDARISLADTMIESGRLEEAAKICSEAVSDSPDMPNLYLKLGEIRTRQRRYDDGLKHFETARGLAPYTHPPKVLLAVYCLQNGDAEKARSFLGEAHSESPEHPVPALYLGQLARQGDRHDAARKYLATAGSLTTPENWPESHKQRFLVLLHSERLRLAQQLRDVELARDALSAWLEVEPENRQLQKMFEELRISQPR